jgi:hypothetical protein
MEKLPNVLVVFAATVIAFGALVGVGYAMTSIFDHFTRDK